MCHCIECVHVIFCVEYARKIVCVCVNLNVITAEMDGFNTP